VAHTILVIAYQMLQARRPYHDLGADYFDRLNEQALTRRLVRRLNGLEGTRLH
jgi:transposase